MSDDPEQPEGGRRPELDIEALRALRPQPVGPTTGLPGPAAGVAGPTTGLPGPTTGLPGPILGPTTGHTATVILGPDGRAKPGRYVIETRQITEFEVLEEGHVVIRRTEAVGGEPERQD